MKILNIHGYQAKAENSVFYALQNNGYEPVSLQLDYESQSPEEVLHLLTEAYSANHCEAVTGSSMGGFFAMQINALYHCPAVLINPFTTPFIAFPDIPEFMRGYMRLTANLAEFDPASAYAVIGEKDDMIQTHDFIKDLLGAEHCVLVPDGGHPGSTLPLEEIFREHGRVFFGN